MLIEFNKHYRHKGNGEIYQVHEKVLLKTADGTWQKGCLYRPKDGDVSEMSFVRSDKNFVDRFEAIELSNPDYEAEK
jgi:hypothetical protein